MTPPVDSALVARFFHFLGILLLPGTHITYVFWVRHALKSGEPAVIRRTFEGIHGLDKWHTNIGAILIAVSGVFLWGAAPEPPMDPAWLYVKYGFLGLSALLWRLVLVPRQKRMIVLAREAERPLDDPDFMRTLRSWVRFGVSTIGVLLIAVAVSIYAARTS